MNQSHVKSYAVVLETQVYDKAIKYLGTVEDDLMKTLKVSQDKSKNDKEAQCLKFAQKVAFKIAGKASNVYILSEQNN